MPRWLKVILWVVIVLLLAAIPLAKQFAANVATRGTHED